MKLERYLIIAYDIKDDAKRNYLARRLIYYGLQRVQYSVFKGSVLLDDKEKIIYEIKEIGLDTDDKVHIIDICYDCKKSLIVFGKEPIVHEHLII